MFQAEPLDPANLSDTAWVLARAFRDNPGMLALLPGATEEVRLRKLGPCMDGFTRSVVRYGTVEVVKDGGQVVAAALSFPPGRFPPPFWATVIQSKGPILAGPRAALRSARLDQEMRKRHPHYPHHYLWILGVEPGRQGQGLGSVLLRSLSAKADADGVPCYLETDKPTSVKIYQRHGYEVVAEDELPPVALKLWFMNRPVAGPR
ncbi:MAG TPA: GNAT family N-acetyltransferase [Polyangiaceae bacterium]|nr:GNAT family N-acetyltransferase [Polyangiaceae bacterium]